VDIVVDILKQLNIVPVPLLDGQAQVVRARALLEANREGVFHALAESPGGMTSAELAEKLGFAPDGANVLLRALNSMGYLRERGGRYSNGRWVRRWILDPKRGLHYMLRLQLYTYHRLEGLGQNLKTGRPTMDFHAMDAANPTPQQETYTRAMREAARLIIPDLLKRAAVPPKVERMLDIGGAHGEYSRAFVNRFAGLKAKMIDLAGPVATAAKIMEEEGNPEGLELAVGDALRDDFGKNWDLVLLANMVHLFNTEQNVDMFKRCRAALKPGGSLLVMDQFTGLGRRRDHIFAVISLNFFNVGGKAYDVSEMNAMLREAGFDKVQSKPFSLRTPGALIQAWA